VSVSLYDVLDVAPDAGPEQIRTAWKAAIADLEPGDRRFRAYNEAAEVLLDPDRRASYDAELALQPDAEEDHESAPATAEEVPPPGPGSAPPTEPLPATPEAPGEAERRGVVTRIVASTWLLVVLAALTLAFAGTAAWVIYHEPADSSVEKSLRTAEGTAQTAAPVIFSYDYRHLDDDHDAAVAYLTSDYRTSPGGYDDVFDSVIKQNAPKLKTVVKADFISSGIVRTGGGQDANDRVDVLVVFDQVTTNKQVSQPQRSPAYAVLTMENVDGDWLVDDITGPQVPR
jgi:Mce-associated membrane protein